jgi:protein-S-isoprenylcysteine O-methyltransferase Ste14
VILPLAAGSAAFVLLSVADLATLRERRLIRAMAFAAATVLFCGALALAAVRGPRLAVSPGFRAAGGILAALSLALAAVSLFREVPTPRIYLGKPAPRRLVTTGTYALCRHPGVLWLTVFLASLAALAASRDLAILTPIWIAMDVIHVHWQERRYLIPVFGSEYLKYRNQVPFLVPSARSIRRALGAPNAERG